MKSILIAGDSFAADWSLKYNQKGWPNFLASKFRVKNVAQAGCSQYKIYKQLTSNDLKSYDTIIISHTSPYRLYCKENLLHQNDVLHDQSDYIYSDIVGNIDRDKKLVVLKDYFENFFDTDYAEFSHNLLCKEIDQLTKNYHVIHISFFDYTNLYQFPRFLDMHYLYKEHSGLINHLTYEGNQKVFQKILHQIT